MGLSPARCAELIRGFPGARVAVVGDFMSDVYLDARPARLSREAPVMVVQWKGERSIPGGAANAVHNLVALGAQVHPCGVLGDDAAGDRLADFFARTCASSAGILRQPGYETVSKTRVMVAAEGRAGQQVLRIDREPSRPLEERLRRELTSRLEDVVPRVDAVILSDYGYGLVREDVVARVRELAGDRFLVGDSRYELGRLRGLSLVKPNHGEAEQILGRAITSDADCARAGDDLLDALAARSLLLTRGNRGMMLLEEKGRPVFLPAAELPGEVTDVSGAGDTVVALLTLAKVVGGSLLEAAEVANLAAGVVVGKLGAATVSSQELQRAAARAADATA